MLQHLRRLPRWVPSREKRKKKKSTLYKFSRWYRRCHRGSTKNHSGKHLYERRRGRAMRKRPKRARIRFRIRISKNGIMVEIDWIDSLTGSPSLGTRESFPPMKRVVGYFSIQRLQHNGKYQCQNDYHLRKKYQ